MRGEQLASYGEALFVEIDDGLAAIPQDRRPCTYLARGPTGLETGLKGSINTEIIERAGGVNIADPGDASMRRGIVNTSIEQVIVANPDTIITWDRNFYQSVWMDPLWSGIDAVRNKRVYLSPTAPFGWIDRPPSINRIIGLRWLSGLLFPNHFTFDLHAESKTTLFKTILGLLQKQGGSIEIDGRDVQRISHQQLARLVAYVPQAHAPVFPYSVHDMVLMGRTAHRGLFISPSHEDRLKAESVLARLGIAQLSGRDYMRISGGQRQLALIARALALEAPFIVLDEPTASLDFGNQVRVLEQMRRLAANGKGIIMSTHDPDHAFACGTHVHAIKNGRTVASGPVQSTLTAPILRDLYEVEIEVAEMPGGRRVCLPPLEMS